MKAILFHLIDGTWWRVCAIRIRKNGTFYHPVCLRGTVAGVAAKQLAAVIRGERNYASVETKLAGVGFKLVEAE